MNRNKFILLVSFTWVLSLTQVLAQSSERIHYTGTELSNPSRHDGGLMPVVGVHNIQIMRADREHPSASNGGGWTYNHQPMLAYWNGKFYLHYLSDPVSEHVPPSRTLLMTSVDGYHWTNPEIVFPEYKVPDGYTKKEWLGQVSKDLIAVMHQRVGFYVSKDGRLITMGNYGVVLNPKDDPNDGNGIGRVVREIKKDGTLAPIYFIYYNHAFNAKNTSYPYYKKSRDKGFVRACNEILANPRIRMQWVEEADRNDPLIPLNKEYKAFNSYTLPDGRIACLWKHALTSISIDGGNTWAEPVSRAKGFVNSNAKIWGQRLSDGTYVTVYNPSEFRWPLALSLSKDGLNYTTLNLVHGEITPLRYGGNYKNLGPQYVRGIQEGNGCPPDKNLWVAYSMNKEDMWVSRVTVPVRSQVTEQVNDNFSSYKSLADMKDWNLYIPLQAPIRIEQKGENSWLTMSDTDAFDFARAERILPPMNNFAVSFDMNAGQNNKGDLQIEFLDENGIACSRLELTSDGAFRIKTGARYSTLMKYEAEKRYSVKAVVSAVDRNITVFIDGKQIGTYILFAPVKSICRLVFQTGSQPFEPTPETPAERYTDLPNAGTKESLAVFSITNVKSEKFTTD